MNIRSNIALSLVLLMTGCRPDRPRATELLPTLSTAQPVEGKLADHLRSFGEGLVIWIGEVLRCRCGVIPQHV